LVSSPLTDRNLKLDLNMKWQKVTTDIIFRFPPSPHHKNHDDLNTWSPNFAIVLRSESAGKNGKEIFSSFIVATIRPHSLSLKIKYEYRHKHYLAVVTNTKGPIANPNNGYFLSVTHLSRSPFLGLRPIQGSGSRSTFPVNHSSVIGW
jgi:hypothetical protein